MTASSQLEDSKKTHAVLLYDTRTETRPPAKYQDFWKALEALGENLSIETASEDEQIISWTILLKTEFPLEGAIYGSGQAIMMDGQGEDLLAFAVWLRSYIPDEHTLVLWDGSGSSPALLTSQVTLEDIDAALVGSE